MPFSLESADCYIHVSDPAPDPISLLPKRALEFDKDKQQYAWIPHSKAYENLSAFTLNAWIMPKSPHPATGNVPVFIEKDFGGSQSIGIYQNNGSGVFHAGVDTGIWNAVNSTTIPALNRWYMVTLRYDGSTFKLYINGVEEASMNKTGVVRMSTDNWWIAHRPNTGQYLSMGLAELELWDYALTPSEIGARFKTPNTCSYRPAYIHIESLKGNESSSVPSYIASASGATNPLKLTSSIGAMISVDGKSVSKECYIASGAQQDTEFDMITDVQNRSEISFDTIVFIRGGSTSFNEYIIGRIQYPITREATRPLTIHTKELPGQITSYLDCYIMRHNVIDTSTKSAYIVVGESTNTAKNAFISGLFQSTSGTQACFINAELRVSHPAYIEGSSIFSRLSEQDAYINAEGPLNMSGNVGAYVVGPGPHSSISCFIPVANNKTSSIEAYIHTVEPTPINRYRYAYMYGAGVLRRSINAYIDGVFATSVSTSAYIVTNPIEEKSIMLYMNSAFAQVVNTKAHLVASDAALSSKNAYLHANLTESKDKSCYMAGVVGRESARRAFINSEGDTATIDAYIAGVTSGDSSITSFIVGNYVLASKICHIAGGDAQAFKPAFIRGTDTVLAYIEGATLLSSVKRAFLMSIGQRQATRRTYIEGT